jgi:hypothetical protein
MSKLCIYCKHWGVDFEGDWSEVTPGSGFTTRCQKGKWIVFGNDMTEKEFRQRLEIGLSCDLFEKAEQ